MPPASLGQLRATEGGTRLVQYSAELYSRLEQETGLATGFKRCGGVTVARTEDRMVQLRRTAATAEVYDLECELITPAQAQELYPPLAIEDLVGAIWLPGDGTANPVGRHGVVGPRGPSGGARIFEHTRVIGIGQARRPGDRGATEQGPSRPRWWSTVPVSGPRPSGDLAGVNVPLHSAEHFYVVSERIEGVHPDLPILRDPDGYTYFKEEVGGLVIGGFEPEAKPWVAPDRLPHPFEFQLLEEDWEHFSILMESALHRIPALHHTGIRKFYNGPESFTPDNQFILGEAPELRNFFVGPASTPWASPRPGERAGPWPSGSWRANPPPTWSPWTSGGSPPSTATSSGSATGWGRSSGCTTRSRGPTASWSRPAPSVALPSTRNWRQLVPCSGRRWAGSGPTSSPRPVRSPSSGTRGIGPTGWAGRWRSSAGPAPVSPCSTRPRSASS